MPAGRPPARGCSAGSLCPRGSLPLSGCFSLKQHTCPEGPHPRGPLDCLFIWGLHLLRAPGQEPLWTLPGVSPGWGPHRLSGQGFCLPLAYFPHQSHEINLSSGFIKTSLPLLALPLAPLTFNITPKQCTLVSTGQLRSQVAKSQQRPRPLTPRPGLSRVSPPDCLLLLDSLQ